MEWKIVNHEVRGFSFSGVIPDGVEKIANISFGGSPLTSLTLPGTVKSIGSSAFDGCSRLTSISLPDSLTTIVGGAFKDCSNLRSLKLPPSVTRIGPKAFANCRALKSLTLPYNLKKCDKGAFIGCKGITNLTIPENWTTIRAFTFQNCSRIKSLTLSRNLTSVQEGSFDGCCAITSLTLPSTLTDVGNYSFRGCSGITSLSLPDGLTKIGRAAFQRCSKIKSLKIPHTVTSIGESAFDNESIPDLTLFQSYSLPHTPPLREGYDSDSDYDPDRASTGPVSLTLPSGLTVLCASVFRGCAIKSLVLPQSVTSIGYCAFSNCKNLTSVKLPHGLAHVSSRAFAKCASLTRIMFRPRVSCAFLAWAVGHSRNRTNWQLTTLARIRNVLSLITALALDRRDVTCVDPEGRMSVFEDCGWNPCPRKLGAIGSDLDGLFGSTSDSDTSVYVPYSPLN